MMWTYVTKINPHVHVVDIGVYVTKIEPHIHAVDVRYQDSATRTCCGRTLPRFSHTYVLWTYVTKIQPYIDDVDVHSSCCNETAD